MNRTIKLLIYLVSFLCTLSVKAANNNDDVTLVVTSEGRNKDEAVKNALRSAIEQTYGVFVSSDTQILNDKLVKDEIATLSSGNIKKYREIAYSVLPNGESSVTLEATVSIGKLVSYAKSKGATCEFDGATFGYNLQLEELYEENEKTALKNLETMILNNLPYIYNAKINVEPGKERRDYSTKKITGYEMDATIEFEANSNAKAFWDAVKSTLESISLRDTPTREEDLYNTHKILVMQYQPSSIPGNDYTPWDINTYYYPLATVCKNYGWAASNPYDDPGDNATKDLRNTAVCFTRTYIGPWEESLRQEIRELLDISIITLDGTTIKNLYINPNIFSTPYSIIDSRNNSKKIIIFPKKFRIETSFYMSKEEISRCKGFEVQGLGND
ncbi:MAG: hypothetical protein K2N05_01780 [Muribaculaceae bacterium]|nr:hypothetical protein [Muribaculaceae bacterium]